MPPDTSSEQRDASLLRPHAAAMAASRAAGFGAYLGQSAGGPSFAMPEHCVLVLGPPRSGKTSGIVVPNVLAARVWWHLETHVYGVPLPRALPAARRVPA